MRKEDLIWLAGFVTALSLLSWSARAQSPIYLPPGTVDFQVQAPVSTPEEAETVSVGIVHQATGNVLRCLPLVGGVTADVTALDVPDQPGSDAVVLEGFAFAAAGCSGSVSAASNPAIVFRVAPPPPILLQAE